MYYEKTGKAMNAPKTRACYLPSGTDWYDYWSGEKYTGGQTVTVEAGLDIIPLFVRAGSILPEQDSVNHALQNRDSFNIRVYPGRDGVFTLYDDDGLSYEYEKGACERLVFNWEDSRQKLTISESSKLREGPLRLVVRCMGTEKQITFDGNDVSL
jgi:alpha-D-xyloside xylohydrolase